MDCLFLYQNSISDDKIHQIRQQFTDIEIIDFKDFTRIVPAEGDVQIYCIINLTQVKELRLDDFHQMISRAHYCQFIILMDPEDVERVKRLMKTGGKGFLLADDPIEILLDCIDKTIRFGGFISPRIVALLNKANEIIIQAQMKFTNRHREVLFALLSGKSDKMIADLLKMSYHTMKTHRKKIYKILNVNSQGELFALFH